MIVPESFRTKEISRIGCITDFHIKDIGLIQLLRKMGKQLNKNTSIHCLHNYENNEDLGRVVKDANILQSVFEDQELPTVDVELSEGKLVPEIMAFAERQELDMLAMNSHQKPILGRLLSFTGKTHEIARAIRVPLLIFKNL